MSVHDEWLAGLKDPAHREKFAEVLSWVGREYPDLEPVVKWKQPMFQARGTFIIGFASYPKNMALTTEGVFQRFLPQLEAAGYTWTDNLVRIGWDQPIDHDLLRQCIDIQIAEKAGATGFWREKA